MKNDISIERTDYGDNGVFRAVIGNKTVGDMTYVWADEHKIIINHTGVDMWYQGRGVGKKLISEAVFFARNNNIKIKPICTFAKAVFRATPEYKGVECD